MDRKKRYPTQEFKRLYHLRWGVEKFYKRLKHHQEIENVSGKSVQVVLQDYHAKILAGNFAAAMVVSGHRYLERNPGNNKMTEQLNLAQAIAKMKQYQVILWKLSGEALSRYLNELMLLVTKFKERIQPDRKLHRKVSKFNRRRYWMHYKSNL